MAYTEEPLRPEHAREYVRLVGSGEAPGRDTLQRARANVDAQEASEKARGHVAKAAAAEAAGGGPEDPVADVAAGYELARAGGKMAGATKDRIQSAVSRSYSAVGTPSAATQTITKLIWAAALGIIVLEIASLATGQQWKFSLPGGNPLNKNPYLPLFSGQNINQPSNQPTNTGAGQVPIPGGTQPSVNPSIVNRLGPNAPGFGV